MNSELIKENAPTLAQYNPRVDLLEVRRNAQQYPRIGATDFEKAVITIRPMVYAAFLYRGQEVTKDTLGFISVALVQEIMNDTTYGLKQLSWLEVGMIIRRAVLGGGKELYGVSVASLYSALVDYAKNEGHELSRKV